MQGMNIAGVQFRRAGKIYHFSYEEMEIKIGDHVLVETEKGATIGKVAQLTFFENKSRDTSRIKPVIRKAAKKEAHREFRLTSDEIFEIAKEKITKFKLKMKLLKSEVQYGGHKIIVFFSAPGRVDFRDLVKELAGTLKTRVELKQVGARDEAKLLGGVGICGREYCCSSFLREFVPVSIKMAKNQNLALNPNKVSGGCGRLLCCLTYENEVYNQLRKQLPPLGSKIESKSGDAGEVLKADLLNQRVTVRGSNDDIFEVNVADIIKISRGAESARIDQKDDLDEWAEDIDLEALDEMVK